LRNDLAVAATSKFGGVVVLSFDYMYALEGAAITWGDFLQYMDAAWADSKVADFSDAYRSGLLRAFEQIRRESAEGLKESRVFSVPTLQMREQADSLQQSAELWVIAHELAHHVLRHGTSRPDRQARDRVHESLGKPDVAVEIDHLSVEQRHEIEADVLAMLLVAGEYAGDANPYTEIQAIEGGLLGLLAIGLMDGEWTASHSHPSSLTRMAVLAKVATQRIMELNQLGVEMREELVRRHTTILVFAAWLSEIPICGGLVEPKSSLRNAAQLRADMVVACTNLFTSASLRMFGD
jgi:hypothetical protein